MSESSEVCKQHLNLCQIGFSFSNLSVGLLESNYDFISVYLED